MGEVAHVLVSNGFAHLVHTSGLTEGLPAKVLTELRLMEAREREPETVGRRLRRALTELGPTFVKLGQILATRPDLLDDELCAELEHLQDRAEVVPFDQVRPSIEAALGGPPEEVLGELSPEPVAAASISQVYRGKRKDGSEIALKVQRPGIDEVIESDLRLLAAIASWVGHEGAPGLADPAGTVEEFARSIRRELDFHHERRVLERFRANFEEDERVVIPKVYPELCSRHVLVMQWMEGVRVDKVDAYPGRGSEPSVVARLGVEVVCRQVFDHRFFHADPHPGNIVLLRENTVGFLDYGMVGHLGQQDVEAMADLLRAVMEEDAPSCVRLMQTFTTSGMLEDPQALLHEISEYLAFEAQAIVDEGRVGQAIEALTAILRRHHLELAPRFGLLLKALATIESTARVLDPDLSIVPILRPFIEELVLARYKPSRVAEDVKAELYDAWRLARTVPDDVQAISAQLRRGRLTVRHDLMHHRHLVQALERASGRISFALVLGSLILGSSWLLATNVVAENLGIVGYVVAFLLGIGLVISVLRGGVGEPARRR
jgi:ubiquinone biosynthesis protein